MKKFKINVNGKSYDVEVEEVGGVAPISSAPPSPAPTVKKEPAAAPQQVEQKPVQPATPAPAGSTVVAAPMPGNILSVSVKVGDSVTKGQVLVILEAMKMENEIMAPDNGTVVAVNVSQGVSVNTGDALVSLG